MGDTEVGDLRTSVRVDQHVARLDVAVHESVRVRARKRRTDVDREAGRLGHGQTTEPADAPPERLALDELEDDVRHALVVPGVDHGHDALVVQPRRRARLAPEALELVRIGGDAQVHQLERDAALE